MYIKQTILKIIFCCLDQCLFSWTWTFS